MKKLIFAIAIMFGLMFTSCGNSTQSSNTLNDTVDTVQTVDSVL